ncbi:unnamed protein product, partial [Chrysoparadoxa australica]
MAAIKMSPAESTFKNKTYTLITQLTTVELVRERNTAVAAVAAVAAAKENRRRGRRGEEEKSRGNKAKRIKSKTVKGYSSADLKAILGHGASAEKEKDKFDIPVVTG